LVGKGFGFGPLWKWQKSKQDRERLELEKITESIDIRERVNDVLAEIVWGGGSW
jgi:hypothetical protein